MANITRDGQELEEIELEDHEVLPHVPTELCEEGTEGKRHE